MSTHLYSLNTLIRSYGKRPSTECKNEQVDLYLNDCKYHSDFQFEGMVLYVSQACSSTSSHFLYFGKTSNHSKCKFYSFLKLAYIYTLTLIKYQSRLQQMIFLFIYIFSFFIEN